MRHLFSAAALVGVLFLGVSPGAASAAQPNIVCQGKLFCNSCHLNGISVICTDAAPQAESVEETAPAAQPAHLCTLEHPFCNTCTHGVCTRSQASVSATPARPLAEARPAIECSLENPCFAPILPLCGIHGSCYATMPAYLEVLRTFAASFSI